MKQPTVLWAPCGGTTERSLLELFKELVGAYSSKNPCFVLLRIANAVLDAMSCYPPNTLWGGAAAGISGPAQRFRHAQRARQWLNIPLGPGPGCRDAPFPPTLDVGSTRDARAQLNAQAFQLKTQRKSITITYNLRQMLIITQASMPCGMALG
jgi:hypothetical protein